LSYIRINKHYVHLPYLFLGVAEAVLLGLAIGLAQRLSAEQPLLWNLGDFQWLPIVLFSVIFSCCTLSMGVYAALVQEGFSSMVLRTLVSFCLLGSLSLMLMNWVLGDAFIDQRIGFWSVIIATAFVIIARRIFIMVVDTAKLKRRVVIYGVGVRAKKLLADLEPIRAALGVEIVGCIPSTDDKVEVDPAIIMLEPKSWLVMFFRSVNCWIVSSRVFRRVMD
jgi:FlaA1/EpsC-like NDP-sugar epimerase